MSKTIQYRCENCKRLLFKHDTTKDTCEYQDPGLKQKKDEKGNTMYVECSKCGITNKVVYGGLVAV